MESSEDLIGVIIGEEAGCVLVRLSDGDEIQCRGLKDLHGKWGFLRFPMGRQVRISGRYAGTGRRPRIVEVLNES